MYDRHIDIRNNLVFITEIDSLKMDLSLFSKDITFYCEYKEDWWIERDPFEGREKNEDIRNVALKILADAEKLWAEQQKETL